VSVNETQEASQGDTYTCALCGRNRTPQAWYSQGQAAYCSECAYVDPFSNTLFIRSEDGGWEGAPDAEKEEARAGSGRNSAGSNDTTKILAFAGFFALFLLSLWVMLGSGWGEAGFVFGGMLGCGLLWLLFKKNPFG